jgi:hypothetical protein
MYLWYYTVAVATARVGLMFANEGTASDHTVIVSSLWVKGQAFRVTAPADPACMSMETRRVQHQTLFRAAPLACFIYHVNSALLRQTSQWGKRAFITSTSKDLEAFCVA